MRLSQQADVGQPLPILVTGDPRLRQRSVEVAAVDEVLLDQGARLVATLRAFRRRSGFGRAISAPQAGIPKRLVAMDLGASPFVLINPELVWRSDDSFPVWDDCLSVPEILVRVRRHASVSLTYRDHRFRLRRWNRLPRDLSELVQHEIDHLDGVLMTDRGDGEDAIQPLSRWAELVGALRPRSRLSLANIVEAAASIDPVFRDSPQFDCEPLSVELGARLTLKVETLNPIRSFKARGAGYFVAKSVAAGSAAGFACASAGNFGQALAVAGRAHGLPITVFSALTANPLKIERMRALGAEVRLVGADFDAAKTAGREWAAREGVGFVEDGLEPWISEGAGSIGRKLLQRDDAIDTLLIPLGNGALLNGVARWVKAACPATEIVGVCARGAPAMQRSWRNGPGGAIVETSSADTIADGVAVRIPIPEAVADMHGLVDDVVLVDDDVTLRAMALVEKHAGLVLEAAGALGVAAILADRPRFQGRNLATILCGGNRAW